MKRTTISLRCCLSWSKLSLVLWLSLICSFNSCISIHQPVNYLLVLKITYKHWTNTQKILVIRLKTNLWIILEEHRTNAMNKKLDEIMLILSKFTFITVRSSWLSRKTFLETSRTSNSSESFCRPDVVIAALICSTKLLNYKIIRIFILFLNIETA